jgi:hypothetical protein
MEASSSSSPSPPPPLDPAAPGEPAASDARAMAGRQGATPPPWLGLSRRELLARALGGWRQNADKLRQLVALLVAYLRPSVVRARLRRLVALGHADQVPSIPQLLVAGRDQMILAASTETNVFYRSQGIPWVFHNLRRFLSGPATMLDPIGLFSPRDAIVTHVLQTFHRHPVYDLVLLRAHPDGVEEMARAAGLILAGQHPHQRALESLIEDGAYHERLPAEIAAFARDPHVEARAIPPGLSSDPYLMLAMDQFKDVRGFVRYAARLQVRFGMWEALWAWLRAGFDETLGGLLGVRASPRHIDAGACDPDLVARHRPGLG